MLLVLGKAIKVAVRGSDTPLVQDAGAAAADECRVTNAAKHHVSFMSRKTQW